MWEGLSLYKPHPQGVHRLVEKPRNLYATYVPTRNTEAHPGKGREANIPGLWERKAFSCLRAFAHALPSAWMSRPMDAPSAHISPLQVSALLLPIHPPLLIELVPWFVGQLAALGRDPVSSCHPDEGGTPWTPNPPLTLWRLPGARDRPGAQTCSAISPPKWAS